MAGKVLRIFSPPSPPRKAGISLGRRYRGQPYLRQPDEDTGVGLGLSVLEFLHFPKVVFHRCRGRRWMPRPSCLMKSLVEWIRGGFSCLFADDLYLSLEEMEIIFLGQRLLPSQPVESMPCAGGPRRSKEGWRHRMKQPHVRKVRFHSNGRTLSFH